MRPTLDQYTQMMNRFKALQNIDSNLNMLRAHIDFLVKSEQFDEIANVNSKISKFLNDIYTEYESSYEE